VYNNNPAITFGVISSICNMKQVHPTASNTLTLQTDRVFGPLIISSTGTGTMTLDLSSSNYNLTTTALTIGNNGILNGRMSTITCSDNWTSSAGTFIRGYSTVYMSGVGKTLTTNPLQGFWDLVFPFGSSTTLANDVWAEGCGFSGTLTQAGHLINVSGAGEFALTATGAWDGDIYLNGTGTQYTIPIVVPFQATARIFSKVRTSYLNGTQGSVTVTPAVSTYGGIRLTTINKDYAIAANWSYIFPSGTVHFDLQLKANMLYQMYVDDVATGDRVQTDATETASWTYSVVSESNFTVMQEALEVGSDAVISVVEDHAYLYIPLTNYTGVTWGLTTNASWLSQGVAGAVSGTPDNLLSNQVFYVNITLSFGTQSAYQNYSLSTVNIAPIITTTPGTWIYVEQEFQYWPVFSDHDDGGEFTGVLTNFTWEYELDLSTGRLTFRSFETGTWYFNISIDDMTGAANATAYQNFTVSAIAGGPTSTMSILTLMVGLVFAFGAVGFGFFRREFFLVAGLIWIVVGIYFLGDIHIIYTILSIGIGFILLLSTAVEMLEPQSSRKRG